MERRGLTELQQRLKTSLTGALRAKDAAAVAALRSALAAIDNAAAVDVLTDSARPALGIGARDVPRRELTDEHVEEIVRREIADRESAAIEYQARGADDKAKRLRAEASVLGGILRQG